MRVLALHRLVAAEKVTPALKARAKPDLESHAVTKQGAPPASKARTNDKFDKRSALPVKEGKPDQELYASFPSKSLRRRLWDAVVSGKCTRCSGSHLRVACPKPRQGWEDDFEKEDFFTKPPPPAKAQSRVQLSGNALNLPNNQILSVTCPLGLCLVDTCSDVSVARQDVLSEGFRVWDAVSVGHMGGETLLCETGTLRIDRSTGGPSVVLPGVFVVEPAMLPAGVVALFGVADLRTLGISLDAVMARPGRPWERTVPLTIFGRIRRAFRRCCGVGASPSAARNASPPERATFADPRPPPVDARPERETSAGRRTPPSLFPQRAPLSPDEGEALLRDTKHQQSEELRRRTAHRVAQLFKEELARKQVKKPLPPLKMEAPARRGAPELAQPWPRKKPKYYGVRKGRSIGVFPTWEECERQTKGVASEFRSFATLEEAHEYVFGRRFNYMTLRRQAKPPSSFVGGKALRARLDVWQDGHADSLRVECGLDTMSDVNMAVAEFLHDIHDIRIDDVSSTAARQRSPKRAP